jgi:hypothetical protein
MPATTSGDGQMVRISTTSRPPTFGLVTETLLVAYPEVSGRR